MKNGFARMRRRKPEPVISREHTGIELRVDAPAGNLILANSDHLYYIARYGRGTSVMSGDWSEIFPGTGMSYNGSRDLVISIRPVLLSDSFGENDE